MDGSSSGAGTYIRQDECSRRFNNAVEALKELSTAHLFLRFIRYKVAKIL